MPNNTLEKWEEKTIKQLTTLICDGDWIESKNQSPSGIRLIQTGNVGDGYYKDKPENARYISEDTFKKLNCTEIFSGDCLVSRLPEPLGRACLIPDRRERMITAVDCSIIRFNAKSIIPRYFVYYSMSNLYHSKIISLSTGATRQRISRKNLETITIPVPKIEGQQRIVGILDEAFENIEKAKQNTLQNLNNAKELFDNYLNQIFMIKDRWIEKDLDDVCIYKSGTTISKDLEKEYGDLLYIKVGDMNLQGNEKCITTSTRYADSKDINKNQIINAGAIIFPKRGGAIATNKKRKIIKPTIIDLNTMAIITNDEILNEYFYYWFKQINLADISNGTTVPQINNYSFKGLKIAYPIALSEQQKIVEQLDELQEQTKKLEQIYTQKLKDLDELKQSILQKAFNGEL